MGKAKVAGYVILFFILFSLIGVHPGFVFLFFGAIITIIVYYVNKRKKPKITSNETLPKGYQQKSNNVSTGPKTLNKKEYGGVFPDPNKSEKVVKEPTQTKEKIIDESFQKNYDEIIKKKTFNRNHWNFQYGESIFSKERKFLDALEFCEKNNLRSKSKIRRIKMKMKRWNLENERDIEAILPDYEYLLDLIEEYENKS